MNWVLASASVPFRDTALIVNLVCAAVIGGLLWGMGSLGLLGFVALPILIIVLPVFVQFCILIGEQTANGLSELPDLSPADLNPFESRPITLVAVLLVLHLALQTLLGPLYGPLTAALVVALAAPLAISMLMREDRLKAAFKPHTLSRHAAALNRYYPLLAAAVGVGVLLSSVAVQAGPGALPAVFVGQSLFIATFHATGRLLYEHEEAVGTQTTESLGERKSRILEQGERRDLEKKVAHWQKLVDGGKPGRALKGMMAELAARKHDLGLYAEFFERVTGWQEPAVATVFTRQYVQRLYAADEPERALEVFLRTFDMNPTLRPASETDTLRIAEQAREAERNDVALALVGDFEERFPESSHLGAALAQEARLLATVQRDLLNAADRLYRIEHKYPQVFARPDVNRLAQRVRGKLDGQASSRD